MKQSLNTRVLAWIVAALLLCFVAFQALPYFTYGEEGQTASIFGYLAMPGDYPELEASLAAEVDGYTVNSIVAPCILLQIAAIALIVLLCVYRDNIIVLGASAIWGIAGIISYCVNPALLLGGAARTAFIVSFVAVAVLAIACVVSLALDMRKAREIEEAEAQARHQAMAH